MKIRNLFRKKNSEGATAIEFSIIAFPFFLIFIGIIEVGLTMFIDSSLNTGMRTVARQGIARGYGDKTEIADILKGHMAGLYRNINNDDPLAIRVFTVASVDPNDPIIANRADAVRLKSYADDPDLIFSNEAATLPAMSEQRGAITVYAARYEWDGFTKLLAFALPDYLYSITIVKNEAF